MVYAANRPVVNYAVQRLGQGRMTSWQQRAGPNSSSNVPANIKCQRCRKEKAKITFSTKQLEEVGVQISMGILAKNITAICIDCNAPHLKLELECVQCHKTKEKKFFSKVQRRDPETARCLSCVEARTQWEHQDSDDDDDIDAPAFSDTEDGGITVPPSNASGAGSRSIHGGGIGLIRGADNTSVSHASTGAANTDITENSYATRSYASGPRQDSFAPTRTRAADATVRTTATSGGMNLRTNAATTSTAGLSKVPATAAAVAAKRTATTTTSAGGFNVYGYGAPKARNSPPGSPAAAADTSPTGNSKFPKVKAYVKPMGKARDVESGSDSDDSNGAYDYDGPRMDEL